MEKLKECIEQYSKWKHLQFYLDKIEFYKNTDFNTCVDVSKAILESIAREIYKDKEDDIEDKITKKSSIHKLVKVAFEGIGYAKNNEFKQISTSLSAIASQVGKLRNEAGMISHGKTGEEIKRINDGFDYFTQEFFLIAIDAVAYFLIQSMENQNPSYTLPLEKELSFSEQEYFNNALDDEWDSIDIFEGNFTASEILYNLGYDIYKQKRNLYYRESD